MRKVRYASRSVAGKCGDGTGVCPDVGAVGSDDYEHRSSQDSIGPEVKLPDLSGKTMLVTGASSGLGRAAALRLAAAGARVLAHGRSAEKMAGLAATLGTEPLLADFTRLAEVRRFADAILQQTDGLDAIMHNAGAFYRHRVLTEDGHEATFQTNYLAPFLLQLLLEKRVAQTAHSRVVITTSVAARKGKVTFDDLEGARRPYRPFAAYAATKAMDILFAQELRRRFAAAGSSATAVAVHPGAVATNFGAGSMLPRFLYRIPIRKELLIGYFVHTSEEGAEPLVWLAAGGEGRPEQSSTRTDAVQGYRTVSVYFDRFTRKKPPTRLADDAELARTLWERSEELVRDYVVRG